MLGSGVLTPDEELQNAPWATRRSARSPCSNTAPPRPGPPTPRSSPPASRREFGARAEDPSFHALDAFDGMAAVFHVVAEQHGTIDPDKTMELLKGWKYDSPRGPLMIDPETRDVVQNVYLRRVDKVDGQLVAIPKLKRSQWSRTPGKRMNNKPKVSGTAAHGSPTVHGRHVRRPRHLDLQGPRDNVAAPVAAVIARRRAALTDRDVSSSLALWC